MGKTRRTKQKRLISQKKQKISSEAQKIGKDPNHLEEDPEFKAHVLQQLTALEPYLSENAEVTAMVELSETKAKAEPVYKLSLFADCGTSHFAAEGKNRNLYEAFRLAKLNLVQELNRHSDFTTDPSEREMKITSLLHGGSTLH